MKIVAVIPARINTKRVPNKMLRIVGKHPLVYYAIQNAMKSKWITDIVVTTDSKQIAIIAKQLGVRCIMRNPDICGDDIPLDIVIYDAVKDMSVDYVVTMQPTSPLLRVETLDCAIEYCINDQYDSVISVHNEPKLSWQRGKVSCEPLYNQRLNSQFLPPYYVETGAFLVSKNECVTPDSRLGDKVAIWETSLEESVSVCELQDLALVDMLLTYKKVAIYVNGNSKRGMGHIYRMLELADEFYIRPDIYYDVSQTDKNAFGDTYYDIYGISDEDELVEKLSTFKYDILINDVLDTSKEYIDKLKTKMPQIKIVNFEDAGDGAKRADLVINALYTESADSNVKYGPDYYIAPKTFLYYEPIHIANEVKNVLLTFGGADPMDYTSRFLDIISSNKAKYENIKFYVVVGRANNNYKKILKKASEMNVNVLYDINNMPEVMAASDVAITSRGRTGYELAFLGVPSLVLAQNKQEDSHDFLSEKNGFFYIGINPSDAEIEKQMDNLIFSSKEKREICQNRMQSTDLRNGRSRVIHLIRSL